MTHRFLAMLGLAVLLAPHAAQAAESYDNCTGFIDSVPATISTQGVWCLRKDLSTGLTDVAAITVANNNITIDCNGFKLGGLQAGTGTDSHGVSTSADRQGVTVRRCNIRGFRVGINLTGGGHVVEDNTLNGMTFQGINLVGDGSVARGNTVLTTGGSTHPTYLTYAVGIATAYDVDVIDNTVNGVVPTGDAGGNGNASGIYTYLNQAGTVSGNRVRGVAATGTGVEQAIRNQASGRVTVVENTLNGSGRAGSTGVLCGTSVGAAVRNVVSGFDTAVANCYGEANVEIP
ncbi:NosD domain-containing protein [Agrilutibacter solisilvae]|uniref:Periplasmic copper-binding protein NosD beta helix domain-containing protein n=1 Tax=Agrilutibacter solisilvae TaxID=2763317 RepID=A0A974Y1U1_9GAMM|nr:NosD domain-containing protein [Lysobacter solisilvae]QSX79693.1 hypothetical protein I8J32_007585 [Lysobacter solisilvae]